MNNTFNIRRFGLIVRKDCIENWKRYALMFLMMTGCLAIVQIMISISGYYDVTHLIDGKDINAVLLNKNLLSAVSIMFPIFGVLFASLLMNPMNDKVNRIAYLTIPASNLEKFLTRWITMTIGYIIAFFVALWIVELVRVGICSVKYPNMDVAFLDLSKIIYSGQEGERYYAIFPDKQYFIFALSIYFLCQSLMILGSTFWEKATFIKTFAAIIIIGLAYWLICYLAIDLFYNDFNQFGNVSESLADEVISEEMKHADHPPVFIAATLFFFTLANWTLAYFRFRESEIIKRL